MTPERWQQVKDIFDRAVECGPASRMTYIRETCGDDEELRREVESLLASDAETGSLLDNPLMETGAHAAGSKLTVSSTVLDDSFGPYVPVRVLGEGGMGTVYLARQLQPIRREVALKVVKHGMDSRQVLERFEIERQALALMDYPHVARVLDAGTSRQGRPYFVMEYVDGIPITQYCDCHSLNTRERLQLFIPVCNALQHAHKKGIIHRDVKPSNVLVAEVDGKPVPKVIDFGIARATDQRVLEGEAFTLVGQIIGTPEYMSPEQASLNSPDIDTGTDVYSLGVVLYELLVGALPLDVKALRKIAFGEVLRAIRETPVPKPTARITQMGADAEGMARHRNTDPGQLRRDLSGDLDSIVMKAIDKDRHCRYGSASDFAADIERFLKNEPVLAGPPGAAYRVRKFVVRHKRPVTAAATVVLALIAGIITTAWEARVAGQQRTVAISEKAEAEKNRIRAEQQAAEAAKQRDAAQAASDRATAAEGRAQQERKAALVEKRRADNEAATATAVNDFLQNGLLAQASAAAQARLGTTPDPDLKVRTALDRAARQIAGKFQAQPLVEASIRQTIGNAYQGLGQYPEAQREFERALELRRRTLGEEHSDTLTSMSSLADTYNDQRKYGQAEALHSRTLGIRRRVLGPRHPDTLQSMQGLAAAYHYLGKYDQAEALMKQTLDIRRRVLGPEHPDTLAIMADLATDYSIQQKYGQAEALHTQTLEIQRRVLGPGHPDTLSNMINYADDYLRQGRYPQAEALYIQAMEARRGALGPEHLDTLRSMGGLALVYSREGKYAEAEALHMKTLEIRRRVLGPEHPDTQNSLIRLAESCVAQGKYEQAETLFAQTLEIRRRLLGPEHPDTLLIMGLLGVTYTYLGKYEQAAALQAQILEFRRGKVDPEDFLTLATTNYLAMAYWGQGRYGEAEALESELNAITNRVLGFDNPLTLIVMRAQALIYQSQGKYAEAEARLSKVLATMRHRPEFLQLSLATVFNDLALANQSQGKYAEAEALLREGLAIRETRTPRNWESFRCRSLLGASLAGQKKYAEAEPLLLEGYEGMHQRESAIPAFFRFNLVHAVEQLAQLYRAWGKSDKAAEWDSVAQARKAAPPK